MSRGQHRVLGLLVVCALVTLCVVYRETLATMPEKWRSDAAFSHGFLILPISAWLAWRQRRVLARTVLEPSWSGLGVLACCAGTWVVARYTSVLVIEQAAVVGMISAIVMTMLGWRAARVLLFPLLFLFFAVPFGRALVPTFMLLTAEVATLALRWTGVPILRSHMLITIPQGSFEVAHACSGLNYAITGFVLGVLYAYLTYRSLRKRLLCVAAFLLAPIVANGVRVYVTILVSYLTDMRFGPGAEHVAFGRVFFLAVMLAMFWIGRRWHDAMPADRVDAGRLPHVEALQVGAFAPVALAFLVIVSAPPCFAASVARLEAQSASVAQIADLPAGASLWEGPQQGIGWRPLYRGGIVERHGAYVDPDQAVVEVFIAQYGIGGGSGSEMVAHGNVLSADDLGSLSKASDRAVEIPGGEQMVVREVHLLNRGEPRLVWYWYVVGSRTTTSPLVVKALEALSYITQDVKSERIVALATPMTDGAQERLQSFLTSHAGCIGSGLAAEECR